MFRVKIDGVNIPNQSIEFICPHCHRMIARPFCFSTPVMHTRHTCWNCQRVLPDHEKLIRNEDARANHFFNKKLPEIRDVIYL